MRVYKITVSILLLVFLIGCEKQELNNELEKAILDYQKKIPIPKIEKNSDKIFREHLFIYWVDFYRKENDTMISIIRRSNGIYSSEDYYGVYMIENEIPVVISDKNSLGNDFVKFKIKNNLLKKYITDYEGHYDEYPPIFSYIIKEGKLNLVSIDSIRNDWIGK